MSSPCQRLYCSASESPGCCGLCIRCWLKLSEAEREKRRVAAEIAEREQPRRSRSGNSERR